MGRAIVRQPAVFLFDEPLSNLDAALRVQMRGEIRALHDRLKSTSIFVTHDQAEAMTMADRIVVLRAGQLEQAGPPLELYDRPRNAFVAGFIGSPAMNLVPCNDGPPFPGIDLPEAAQGREVIWGIRPEDMELVSPGTAGAVEGAVTTLETTGATQFIRVDTGGRGLTALFSERHDLARGDRVALRPRAGKAHLFDAGSGARIDG
jgi:multiple sugar transport system ATP-binding protein